MSKSENIKGFKQSLLAVSKTVLKSMQIILPLVLYLSVNSIIGELYGGPKCRRAEPHRFYANIQKLENHAFEFSWSSWQAAWQAGACALHTYIHTYVRTKSPKMAAILQKKLELGRPLTCLILTIPL